MTTKYFDLKTTTKKFDDDLKWTLGEIKGKKVLLFGDIEIYEKLKTKYKLDKLNIVGISKREFAKNPVTSYGEFKAVSPLELKNFDFEVVLVLSENPLVDKEFLCLDANIENKEIKFVFNSLLKDEFELCNYLEEINFSKSLARLSEKLKGKSIIIYGAGKLFDVIEKYYDLSKLNIIGICDEKFEMHYPNDMYCEYKVFNIEEIKQNPPDCILIAKRHYLKVMDELVYKSLKNTGILVKPLARKAFFDVLKEIWT